MLWQWTSITFLILSCRRRRLPNFIYTYKFNRFLLLRVDFICIILFLMAYFFDLPIIALVFWDMATLYYTIFVIRSNISFIFYLVFLLLLFLLFLILKLNTDSMLRRWRELIFSYNLFWVSLKNSFAISPLVNIELLSWIRMRCLILIVMLRRNKLETILSTLHLRSILILCSFLWRVFCLVIFRFA